MDVIFEIFKKKCKLMSVRMLYDQFDDILFDIIVNFDKVILVNLHWRHPDHEKLSWFYYKSRRHRVKLETKIHDDLFTFLSETVNYPTQPFILWNAPDKDKGGQAPALKTNNQDRLQGRAYDLSWAIQPNMQDF